MRKRRQFRSGTWLNQCTIDLGLSFIGVVPLVESKGQSPATPAPDVPERSLARAQKPRFAGGMPTASENSGPNM